MVTQEVLDRLLADDTIKITLIGVFILVGFLIRTIFGMVRTMAREKTRREIAAYIAEGSMTPEQGERLMKAGERTA